MKTILTLSLIFFFQYSFSQNYTVSGYVEDMSSGERIIGAELKDSLRNKKTQTNNYGFFSFNNVDREIAIEVSYVGYKTKTQYFSVTKDTLIIFKIDPVIEIHEVVVLSSQYKRNVNTSLGLSVISAKSLTTIPALGETDLLKAIQLQPGIKGGVEGSAGIYVRGGGSGENLFLLDDVPIYNVSHLYGFFSAFNSSAVKDLKLIKGCFPARYGGRTSSVIDVRSMDGNNQKISGELAIGTISAKATIEGPIWKNKTTFLVSGRRSYFDLFTEPLKDPGIVDESFPDYNFYDLNARITHTFSQKDKIFLSFYNGKDYIQNTTKSLETSGETENFSETRKETSGWGNVIGSLRWNHVLGKKMFVNSTIAYSSYNYYTEDEYNGILTNKETEESLEKTYHSKYTSSINDFIVKSDFDFFVSDNQTLKFGAGYTFHSFKPGKSFYHMINQGLDLSADTSYTNATIYSNEPYLYLEDELKILQKLNVNAGVRFSSFISDSNSYYSIEPRISANYSITPNLSLKTGYSRMVQYIHLFSSSGLTMPTDIWIPSTNGMEPLLSDQVNLGLDFNWEEVAFFSLELYLKKMNHTTDMRNGASLASDMSPWYTKVVQGNGSSKGMEISIEKQKGRIKATLNYTLSVTDRIYDDLNSGNTFPFKYDRKHDFSLSVNYQLTKNWDISAVWIYGTGYPVTLPVERYIPNLGLYNTDSEFGEEIDYYPSINGHRLSPYHRLDLGFHNKKLNRLGERTISIDIFNAYNRKNAVNAYFEGYRYKTLKYTRLLPIIPSVTFIQKF